MKSLYLSGVLFISLFNASLADMIKNAENYGPFDVKWTEHNTCKGPKSKDLANFSIELVIENNEYSGVWDFSFPLPTRMDEVKLVVYSVKGTRKSLLWNYRVDKPCQHYAIADILEKYFNVKDCVFKKGNHHWTISFTECTYKYLGTSFFYGEFSFKLVALSKKGNIACIYFNPIFTKKN